MIGRCLRHVDRIPWPVTATAGAIGFLVLLRFVQIQLRGGRR